LGHRAALRGVVGVLVIALASLSCVAARVPQEPERTAGSVPRLALLEPDDLFVGPEVTPSPTPQPTAAPTPAPTPPPTAVAATTAAVGASLRVPVLMYHYIDVVPADDANPVLGRSLRVPPDLFEQHLAYLKANGYQTISTPQLWDALHGRGRLPARPVILTFDDGYADAYRNALPLLKKYGFIGTFFVNANLRGGAYMTWDQVRALAAAGMDVQSHGMDHVSMKSRTAQYLAYQMGESRRVLSAQIGRDVRFFAYPAGDYDANAVSAAAANGYHGSFRKDGGSIQSVAWAQALRRARVPGYASIAALASALAQ